MQINHFANRISETHFETIVEMMVTRLGFFELRRTKKAIWMRQPGANVDLQFTSSSSVNRDVDKRGSQVAFLSETPEAELEKLAVWARSKGLDALVGSWSPHEFYLDLPMAFVDFVLEAMTPEMADYKIDLSAANND